MSGPQRPPSEEQNTDILLGLWMTWRIALAPLGIPVVEGTLGMWRDLQAHGAFPFTRTGEIAPDVVAGLAEAARKTQAAIGAGRGDAGQS